MNPGCPEAAGSFWASSPPPPPWAGVRATALRGDSPASRCLGLGRILAQKAAMVSHESESHPRLPLLLQRKSIRVTRRGRVPWKRPGRIPGRALSSRSVPPGGSTSLCNATSPLATAGVCWWIRGARCPGPPRGKPSQPSSPPFPEPVQSLRWTLGQERQLPVRLASHFPACLALWESRH